MASSRLRSVVVFVALLFLVSGGVQSAYGYDGCTVLPNGFPGREVLQVPLDYLLAGACGRHDACYSNCSAGGGLQSYKDTCDLMLLLELEAWCAAVATTQEVANIGLSPEDFVGPCVAAMAGAYVAVQGPLGQIAYQKDQQACVWAQQAADCQGQGGTWDTLGHQCRYPSPVPSRCVDVDAYTIANCELGGWWEWSMCLCLGDGASPIIVDLGGKGFHLTAAANGVDFDINGNGVKERLAWTHAGSNNAFLVLDRNLNGKIDDGRELFGNFTFQPPSKFRNGFRALAVFDRPDMGGNGDGKLTAADLIFSELQLWVDLDHDGIVGPLELWSLADWGIVEIDLNHKRDRRKDSFGNQFRYRADVVFADHHRSTAYDVFLMGGRH